MEESKPGKITIDGLGYCFTKKRQGEKEVTELREKKTGGKFKFDAYGDESKNQERYEELGEAVKDYVQDVTLQRDLRLLKILIPVDAGTDEPQGFFFMSEYALYFNKLIILLHGGGAVRAGQWSRSVIINENLEDGTVAPYIERALKEGFGVIVTNGNHNRDSNNRPIKGSESAEEHFVYVWNKFIRKSKAKHIVIVAHSLGGEVVLHGLRNIDEAMTRITAVAFTHSTHTTKNESMEIKRWLKERARDWVCSNEPLNTLLKKFEDDCDQVSAETMDHTLTSAKAKDSIFEYFREKLNEDDFIRPTQIRLLRPKDRPYNQETLYKMTSSPRGLAVIINMNNFQDEAHRKRLGSEVDAQGLVKLFEGLGFRTETLVDLAKDALMSELQEISSRHYIFGAYDCLVVCIMSHGNEDYFVTYDNEKVKIQSIREMFNNKNCEHLRGKPKLFFINACRGDSVDAGTVVTEGVRTEPDVKPQSSPKPPRAATENGSVTMSENADILTVFSSVEGYVSYRNKEKGSWFIRSLIKVFREYAGEEDLLSMLTRVNKKVNSKAGDHGEKQVSKPENTLVKKVYFWPGMKFESCQIL